MRNGQREILLQWNGHTSWPKNFFPGGAGSEVCWWLFQGLLCSRLFFSDIVNKTEGKKLLHWKLLGVAIFKSSIIFYGITLLNTFLRFAHIQELLQLHLLSSVNNDMVDFNDSYLHYFALFHYHRHILYDTFFIIILLKAILTLLSFKWIGICKCLICFFK